MAPSPFHSSPTSFIHFVSHRFTLAQFRDAMQAIKSRAAQGKVIIRLKESA